MDWSQYSDKENRLPTKVYSDAYVNNWTIEGNELVPSTIQSCQEKARMIDCPENGNKYNITQTLAETFGVFCDYEYKCAENGSFIKEYIDENGNVWQGRKVIFYNRAIKTDKPFMMEYQKNLQSISRTCETDEIYSKLYVTPIESSVMTDGYVTIANTEANPLLDEFILNFDYLYEKGAINDYQKEYIAKYEREIHTLNKLLIEQSKIIEDLTIKINNKKAAQVMIISGCEGNGVQEFDSWKSNLVFATHLQNKAGELYPGLMRPVFFCHRKYNMDVTPCSLLLEFGTDANTLEEAVYSAQLIGNTLVELLEKEVEEK